MNLKIEKNCIQTSFDNCKGKGKEKRETILKQRNTACNSETRKP